MVLKNRAGQWYENFLASEMPKSVNVYSTMTGNTLWQDIFPPASVANASNNFNIHYPLNFNYRFDNYIESFTYASSMKLNGWLEYIVSNLPLLEKFNIFFRSQAKDVITKAVESKIIIPEVMRAYDVNKNPDLFTLEDKRKFLCLIDDSDIISKLSNKEYVCLEYLSHGMTVKEIAKVSLISPRTVETHINKIKAKLNCSSKSQLAKMYWKYASQI